MLLRSAMRGFLALGLAGIGPSGCGPESDPLRADPDRIDSISISYIDSETPAIEAPPAEPDGIDRPCVDWVIGAMAVAPGGDGFDLDGDGDVDNALSALSEPIDELLARRLGFAERSLVVQIWGDLTDGLPVFAGLYTAEEIEPGLLVDPSGVREDGRAIDPVRAEISEGRYAAVFPERDVVLFGADLTLITELHLAGQPGSSVQEGLIGLVIPADALQSLLDRDTPQSQRDSITSLADIDTDLDGEPDALSAALSFRAELAALVR